MTNGSKVVHNKKVFLGKFRFSHKTTRQFFFTSALSFSCLHPNCNLIGQEVKLPDVTLRFP